MFGFLHLVMDISFGLELCLPLVFSVGVWCRRLVLASCKFDAWHLVFGFWCLVFCLILVYN